MTKERQYWAERYREGEIGVVCRGDPHAALAAGKAYQFYEFEPDTAIQRLSAEFPEADLWYIERNGDPITMLVPKGTEKSRLPTVAMDYLAYRFDNPALGWGKHDDESFQWLSDETRKR